MDIDNLILSEYMGKNYKIEYNQDEKSENYAIIYFSSNGLYYPNDEETFKKCIIKENRYEWSKNKIKRAKKYIFVRDLFKQWYITGINNEINTIDKLHQFLKSETKGYKIITVGSSAGGYAATLFGILLKAEYVLSFAAQFTLYPVIEKNNIIDEPLLFKYLNDESRNKYYDLSEIILKTNVPIYYFCPIKCDADKPQLNKVKDFKSIKTFKINSKIHGIPFTLPCLIKLLQMDKNQLDNIYEKYKNKEINDIRFSCNIAGLLPNIIFAYKLFKKKFIKAFLKR